MSGNKERITDFLKCPNCEDKLMYWYVLDTEPRFMNGICFYPDDYLGSGNTKTALCLANKVSGILGRYKNNGMREKHFDSISALRCSNCIEICSDFMRSRIVRVAKLLFRKIMDADDSELYTWYEIGEKYV